MKITAAYKAESAPQPGGMNILVWPDSSMVRSGKPVFIPDDRPYMLVAGYAAHITAVGKSIGRKFAGRYYSEVAPVAFLLPEEAAKELAAQRDPKACDVVADYTVIIGDFTAADSLQGPTTTHLELKPLNKTATDNETTGYTATTESITSALAEAIAEASRRNTLKTGDFVAYMEPKPFDSGPDLLLTVRTEGKTLLENKLK